MTAIATPRHRVSVAVARVHAELDGVADASVWSMDPAEAASTLVELSRAENRIVELKARVAAHADDLHVGHEIGASSAADWLAHATQLTRPAARSLVRFGHDLEQHPATRDVLAAGDLHVDQAKVILRWVDQLPADLDAELRVTAEAHLLAKARDFDARHLNTLGRRVFEVIAPDLADAHEAQLLAAEETAAWAQTYLTASDDGHGMGRGHFAIPILHLAALKKMLHATAAKKHQAATNGAGVETRPTPEALGHAFCELITRYPTKHLPNTGGLNATLLVLIDEDSLLGRIEKAGTLDTGEKISPNLARQLACEAGIIPIVMGGDSEPLDIGRERRLHTRYQRLAMLTRDKGCRAEGCDRHIGLHAHHQTPWTDGGTTTVKHGVTLCHWHHRKAHDTTYQTTHHPNGNITFHRRT